MRRKTAVLSLGSNEGMREERLLEAVRLLGGDPSVILTAFSPLYETEPIGVRTSACFVNAVVIIEFEGTPEGLLHLCRDLERRAGRRRPGPDRPLDVDIILFGEIRVDEPELTIPHPRFRERLFVLAPLADVAPDMPLPPDGKRAPELIGSHSLKGWIRKISGRSAGRPG